MTRRLPDFAILVASALALSACAAAAEERTSAWLLPFDPDAEGCPTISTPFSVANPWDHAHEALDFACLPGSSVVAVTEGEVVSVERLVVRGEDRYRVALSVQGVAVRVEYANLRSASVSPGARVRAGDAIGESALGLHVAVWSEDEGRYVDPGIYLPLGALIGAP